MPASAQNRLDIGEGDAGPGRRTPAGIVPSAAMPSWPDTNTKRERDVTSIPGCRARRAGGWWLAKVTYAQDPRSIWSAKRQKAAKEKPLPEPICLNVRQFSNWRIFGLSFWEGHGNEWLGVP